MCSVSVGVLGDVCRALDEQIYPYCDGIMQVLLTNLQSEDVQRTIKPMILSSFSDIALAIGDKFEKYLPHVLTMLQSAQVTIPPAALRCRNGIRRPQEPAKLLFRAAWALDLAARVTCAIACRPSVCSSSRRATRMLLHTTTPCGGASLKRTRA